MASDLWCLGCLLYHMFTGAPPFQGESYSEVKELVLNTPLPAPNAKGSRLSSKPSTNFCSLINKLLKKDPKERISWNEFVVHPFWEGQLKTGSDENGKGDSPRLATSNTTQNSDLTTMSTTSNMRQLMMVAISPDGRPLSQLSSIKDGTKQIPHTAKLPPERPQTSPDPKEASRGEAQFTLSLRPRSSPACNEDVPLTKPTTPQRRKTTSQTQNSQKKSEETSDSQEEDDDGLVYVIWDMAVTPLCDNPKIQKPASLKFDAKALPITPHSKDKLSKFKSEELLTFLNKLADHIAKLKDKSAVEQRTKLQMLNYAASVCMSSHVAGAVFRSKLLPCLQQCLKATQNLEIRCRAGRVIGLAAQNLGELTEDIELTEIVTALTEVIRDNAKNARLKQGVLPALGELLFLIATHEDQKGHSVDAWTVHAVSYTMISRCIRDGEDAIVQHYSSKIIENLTSTNGVHCQKLTTNENGHLLWHLFIHSSADTLKVSAISALCRLAKHSAAIFQGVIEKVGLPAVLEGLAVNIPRVQQAIVTMFAWILTEGAHLQRLVHDKDFTLKILKLVESPSIVIRAKAFLTILKIITKNSEMIPLCCQSRLVMFIERDWRKQQGSEVKGDQGQSEYLMSCLELLMSHLVESVPQILGDAVSSLNAVSGRKHPSSIQAKALKTSLPLITLPHYLMTSQIFRPQITHERFLVDIGDLLVHVNTLDTNETNIDSAIGSAGVHDFIHSVLGILEVISHHPVLLMDHHSIVVENILPPLASLVSSDNGDTRLFCLGLFADIVSLYLNHDHLTEEQSMLNERFLSETITVKLLPQMEQILLDADPMPLFGSKLLLALVEGSPALIRNIEELELIPVLFQVLIDHQTTPTSSVVRHLINIFCCLVVSHEVNMQMLYDQGLVDHLMSLCRNVWSMYQADSGENKSAVVLMASLVELLHSVLKYVAGVVRTVLQATKAGQNTNTDVAENLLLSNKSLVELTDILIQVLCISDTDLCILSCGCLSLLAQLFGGEYSDALSTQNANGLAQALLQLDAKQQKVLLKFIKRIIAADPAQAQKLSQDAHILGDALKKLIDTASYHADVAISSLSADILKSAGITY